MLLLPLLLCCWLKVTCNRLLLLHCIHLHVGRASPMEWPTLLHHFIIHLLLLLLHSVNPHLPAAAAAAAAAA
jgi:hypothetical protein